MSMLIAEARTAVQLSRLEFPTETAVLLHEADGGFGSR